MTTNSFLALATRALLWFILFFSVLYFVKKVLSFVLLAPQAHCTNIILRYLFPWSVFRPFIFPALQGSSLLVTVILGGALLPLVQGAFAYGIGNQHSFFVPALSCIYIAFFGFYCSRNLGKVNTKAWLVDIDSICPPVYQ